ncbi:MAG: Ti-type conjugative transfer relaxase TraA [Steroidobacteraceae bacterium]
MAIYHLSAKIVSRARGHSAVAAAAYRAGESLLEDSTGITFDYTRKDGVEHREILAPEGASDWVHDRIKLWNAVEASEKRRDAQLAREIEIGLPVELDPNQQLALLRDYVQQQFVSQGMVADLAIHRDNPENPHAHVLLTTRTLTAEGFGAKERAWNSRAKLREWRAAWAEAANLHLARAGLAIRIDHRTLQAQGLAFEPGRKIGVSLERQQRDPDLPLRIRERIAEQQRIAEANGERILADPTIALRAITHTQATFTEPDLAKYLHTRTHSAEQFTSAYLKVTTHPDLVPLGRDDRGRMRYASREMIAVERSLLETAEAMTQRREHDVAEPHRAAALAEERLSPEQRTAFDELVAAGDLKALVGVAGSGKSRLLGAARLAWEAEGYTVKGAALSGIAAENLTVSSAIPSRTLASLEYAWQSDRDPLTDRDVLVIDEAGMVGTRQLAHVLEKAATARAKVVLVGDPEQLQAIEAGAPFRGILAESGFAELTEVRRQHHDWQREATRELAAGGTREALTAYERAGAVVQGASRQAAREALLARWAEDGTTSPRQSRLILAYTRDDVHALNEFARSIRRERGELGAEEVIETERGRRTFAVNDRLYFLRNERSLGVKNGTLGTIEAVGEGVLQVRLDGTDDRVIVDTHFYRDLDHGYAATVYKAQGTTVDRSYILATSHYDRHTTYVALSRHRETSTMFYAAEDFVPPWRAGESLTPEQARSRWLDVLSRARPKELAHDYLDHELEASTAVPTATPDTRLTMSDIDALQQRSAERWLEEHPAGELLRPSATGLEQARDLNSEVTARNRLRHPHRGQEDDLDV